MPDARDLMMPLRRRITHETAPGAIKAERALNTAHVAARAQPPPP